MRVSRQNRTQDRGGQLPRRGVFGGEVLLHRGGELRRGGSGGYAGLGRVEGDDFVAHVL